jgi:hypothetical protein
LLICKALGASNASANIEGKQVTISSVTFTDSSIDLRHSCASLLLIADENPKVVSERLGHSTVAHTFDT